MRPTEEQPLTIWFGTEEVEMSTPNDEFKLLDQLYAAALTGSIPALTELIRNDPQILHRLSLSSKPETPLHVSSLSGHLDFTQALLKAKPELASRLDSFKRSPLHLASAEGHTEVVRALLKANTEVCLVADQEGRIPLHLAVMRGKVEIIKELVDAKPESIHQTLNESSTVVHLCVQYNQLEALRLLVTLLVVDKNQLLEFRDHGGNTILHFAVMLRQSETIKYLVSVPEIKAKINSLNRMGLSALDLIEHFPRDFKSLEIGDILIKAGSRRSIDDEDRNPSNKAISVDVSGETQVKSKSFIYWLKGKIKSGYYKCRKPLRHQSDWVEKMQGTLMLVATLTATISFQVIINPPGGVWQQDHVDNVYCKLYGFRETCEAGTAVMSYVYPNEYSLFTTYAIVSFIASLSVVLLAVSGLPLKNKVFTWLMTIAVISSITFLLLTFVVAMWMVTPNHIFGSTSKVLNIIQYFWVGLLGMVAVFGTIRLLFWLLGLLSKLKRFVRGKLSDPVREHRPIC